jgi:dihydrolipoamide dehydrogenase
MNRYDLVVVGGGPAGVTAALRARELGAARVALVEKGLLGGTCTNDGCAPTRVLAKAARLLRDAEQLGDYGLHAERPEVNFAQVLARTQQVVYQLQEKKQLVGHLQAAQIDTFLGAGNARFVDAHRLEFESGQQVEGAHFVLAVGGRPRRLDFPGAEYALTHSDVWQMTHLPASLVIVGTGATGCQLASIFESFGAAVTLLELAPRILPPEDVDVAELMQGEFTKRGVEIITSIKGLNRIEPEGGGLRVYFDTASGQDSRVAEIILLSVGWPSNADHLNLVAAGVEVRGNFIAVDDMLRTTAPHIYAAGDVTGRMMLVQSAAHQARVAVENALLGANRVADHRVVPHGGFTDPEYASVGMTEAEARAQGEIAISSVPYADMDRAVIDGRTVGFCKLIVSRETRRIVGAHVVGEQAVEIVQVIAAGMTGGVRIEHLAELEFSYPTFAAIVGVAARQIARELDAVPIAREWRLLTRLRPAEWERVSDDRGAE